jgi:predicted dithiol-disulfide oxidoreductase (DUF899 family)
MIIIKLKQQIPESEANKIKLRLQELFHGESVLVIASECDIIFRDEDKKRCTYCAQLNEKENNACTFCGARL